MIKVHILSGNGLKSREVSLEEAKKLMEEAYTYGNVVLDRKTGTVIDALDDGINEIIVVGLLAGG